MPRGRPLGTKTTEKRCYRCGYIKPITEFPRRRRESNCPASACMLCDRDQALESLTRRTIRKHGPEKVWDEIVRMAAIIRIKWKVLDEYKRKEATT